MTTTAVPAEILAVPTPIVLPEPALATPAGMIATAPAPAPTPTVAKALLPVMIHPFPDLAFAEIPEPMMEIPTALLT
jgi:hypothetical protein